ncbi:AAA family ATPase [Streptomyces polygonati]|uniref:AAA family ATPase n=1 Tax=Streptomyces polygonati TaxID=1617087 RepID=A0ABV8HI10_9ACTN
MEKLLAPADDGVTSGRRAAVPRPLLGRSEEQRLLDDVLDKVRDGLSGVLVLVGEAGIGKTRLLDYAGETGADLRVLRLSGVESEARLGFAALHRLLRPFLPRLDRLPGPQRDALRSAFGLADGPASDRYLVGLATLTLLADVDSPAPLLCLVDDVQWVDGESAHALAFLGRRLFADGVGLVVTGREGEAGLGPFAGLPVRRLTGLADDDARALLAASVAGRLDPAVAGRVVADTGGNPLALIELADELAGRQLAGVAPLPQPLPVSRLLEAHFLRRVLALPEATRSLLLVLSAAPQDDPAVLWRAAALLGLSADAMDPAVEHGVLSRQRHPAFRHPLIRSAVHAGARPAELRRVHGALAAGTDRDTAPDRRAWHLAEAAVGLDEEVAGELEQAAERARNRGGYAAQAIFLARAAELTPDPQDRAKRFLAAAQAHLVIGDAAMARTVLDQAGPVSGTPVTRAAAQRLRAALAWVLGRATTTPSLLIPAAVEVAPWDERLARDMVFEAMVAAMLTREYTVGVTLDELARTVRAMPWNRSLPASVPDLLVAAYTTRIAEGYAPAVPKLRTAVEALRSSDLGQSGLPMALLSYVAAEDLWDDAGCWEVPERISSFSRDQGALHALNVTLYALAASEVWAGRFTSAEAYFGEAAEIGRAIGMPAQGSSHRVELLAWQGREAQTREAAGIAMREWAERFGHAVMASHAHYSLTILELGAGRYREALSWALRGFAADVPGQGNRLLPDLVEAAVRAGDHAAASAALRRVEERAPLSGTPWALGVLARCRALTADDDRAGDLYEEAAEHLGKTRIVTELARTHLLHGEWLRRRRRRSDARVPLRAAYGMFTDMGAVAFAERARLELLATGEHARRRTAVADRDLTPQEGQVAALAAGGATNAEIATRLFVTVSTVEYHLNKVFRKLGITSRRQLASVLRPGPADGI